MLMVDSQRRRATLHELGIRDSLLRLVPLRWRAAGERTGLAGSTARSQGLAQAPTQVPADWNSMAFALGFMDSRLLGMDPERGGPGISRYGVVGWVA